MSFSSQIMKLRVVKVFKKVLSVVIFLLVTVHESYSAYREHFVNSERICPNPLHNTAEEFPKHTLLVNLPKTLSLFGPVNDFPCNFASASEDTIRKVIVRAIHPSKTPWDFSTSQSCDYFIKFKRTEWQTYDPDMEVKKNEVICRVWKQQPENALHTGSFFHPMMWNSPNKMMTLSFSTTDWDGGFDNNFTVHKKSAYIQMVFLVYGDYGKYCSLRLQQYLLDPLSTISANNCSISSLRTCGVYDCSETKNLLNKLGFLTYEIDETNHLKYSSSTSTTSTKKSTENSYLDGYTTLSPFAPVDEGNESKPEQMPTSDPFDTLTSTRTIYSYNSSNTVTNNLRTFAVASIIIVPIIVIVLAVLAFRCYVSQCNVGLGGGYGSTESLIVPSARHPLIMHTTVMEDGRVELNTPLSQNMSPFRTLTRNNSMDYIQPINLRNSNWSSVYSKKIISNPPSYETLHGPPRYSDAIVI